MGEVEVILPNNPFEEDVDLLNPGARVPTIWSTNEGENIDPHDLHEGDLFINYDIHGTWVLGEDPYTLSPKWHELGPSSDMKSSV